MREREKRQWDCERVRKGKNMEKKEIEYQNDKKK